MQGIKQKQTTKATTTQIKEKEEEKELIDQHELLGAYVDEVEKELVEMKWRGASGVYVTCITWLFNEEFYRTTRRSGVLYGSAFCIVMARKQVNAAKINFEMHL